MEHRTSETAASAGAAAPQGSASPARPALGPAPAGPFTRDDGTARGYPGAPWRPEAEAWPDGAVVEDGFRWMEDARAPETLAWVAGENAYTDAFFEAETPGRVSERAAALRASSQGASYSSVARVPGGYVATRLLGGERDVVLLDEGFSDPRALFSAADAPAPCKVVSASPCPADPALLACCVLFDRAPRLSLLVRDTARGETLARLDGLFFWSWDAAGENLYYSDAVEHPEEGTNENFVRRWERAGGRARLVHACEGSAVFCEPQPDALGGLFILEHLDYGTQRVLHLGRAELERAAGAGDGGSGEAGGGRPVPRLVSGDARASFAYVGTLGREHLLLTDWQAPFGRVVAVPDDAPDIAGCRTVVPERAEGCPRGRALLSGAVATAAGDVLCAYQDDGAASLEARGPDGRLLAEVELPGSPVAMGGAEGALAPCCPPPAEVFLEVQGFRCPPSVLRYSAASRAAGLLHASGPGVAEAGRDVVVERLAVPARDGETLTAYLVRRADARPAGDAPALFYGYGGYNVSLGPDYVNAFIGMRPADWARRGGVYVHCILRGGGERGPAWHEAGWRANKPVVFHDFADIIRFVQESGWTRPERSAACGGSNGGLLVTATATQEPGLLACAVASVPHTDMLRFVHDDRGPMYVTEYGDPRDPALFGVMRGYSPYHNIRPGQRYPALYVQTGELDNNVPPYHGKKFAARMQREASPANPCVLRVLARGAHDRGEGDAYWRTVAEMQCFLEHGLGMDGAPEP